MLRSATITTLARHQDKLRAGAIACLSQQASSRPQNALVLGSSGCLGGTVAKYLARELGMNVLGADVIEVPSEFNQSDWELDAFIQIPTYAERPTIADVTTKLATGVHEILSDSEHLDLIVCASGGWAGDPKPNAADSPNPSAAAQEYGETIDKMMYMNFVPVVAAGFSAQYFCGPNGLFVVIGATAALASTPGMLGYGLSKTAAHHLVQTMGATTGKGLDTKIKRTAGRRFRQHAENLDTLSVIGILPTTIDTPSNRQFNPGADYRAWTKPNDIAVEIGKWVETPQLRPHSGALIKVTTKDEGSTFEMAR